jgi:hypothetical protein
MNLLELQRRMSQDVMRPLTPDFAMQPIPEQGLPSDEIAASYIKPNCLLNSFERLEIYNRQYWFRVIDAVSEDFPALRAVLGQEKFDLLVLAYLRENPSTSFTLRNLGARLPAWLASYPALAGPQHALAVDVARLEWAYIEAFDGASLMPLGWEDFAGLGRDSTLRLQPHLQLLDLQYPVDDVVIAVHKLTPAIDIVSNAVSERRQSSEVTLPEVSRPMFTWLCIVSTTPSITAVSSARNFCCSPTFATVIRSPLQSSVRSRAASSLRICKPPGSRITSRMPQSSAGSACHSLRCARRKTERDLHPFLLNCEPIHAAELRKPQKS